MTGKRFKQVVGGVKDTRTGRTLTHSLEFTLKLNEINDLYDCVFDRNEKLEKENAQLKQIIYEDESQIIGEWSSHIQEDMKKLNEAYESDDINDLIRFCKEG